MQKAELYGILDDYLDGHEEVLGPGQGNAEVVQAGGLQALWHHLELDDDDDDDDDDWEDESEEGSSSDEWTDCSSSSSGGGSTTGSDEEELSDGSSCGSDEELVTDEEADHIVEDSQVFEEETSQCSPSQPPEKRISDECTDCSCPTRDESYCGDESDDGSRH
ncbi:nucleolar transcription factor 1-like [Schistocerca serialis cubense]|uniref:nucleolar transcription factor 1-like n=1 Tax=Schistocerca serialis cubense TaxID=2023355 RepID=UPI00214E582F|nr:nucleolar transcription factor 1-like [Schistocerca serialis cubense]